MKKRLTALYLILFLILPSLFGCSYGSAIAKLDESERAAALFDAVNQIKRTSYLLKRETRLSGTLEDYFTNASIVYDSYFFDLDTEAPSTFFETTAETTVSLSGEEYTSSIRTRSGFRDGKMFVQNSPSSSLYSKISAEDYFAYLTEKSVSEEALVSAIKSAETQTCTKNGDGSWYAGFSDFPDAELNLLAKAYFDPAVYTFQNASIKELIVHIESTKKLELKTMQFTLVFDGNASAQTTVTLLEADKEALPTISLYKFKEVSDLRFLDVLKGKINEKLASDSYSVSMKDIVRINSDISTSSTTNTDGHISYSKSGSKTSFVYSYSKSPRAGVVSEFTYRDGVLYSTSGNSETVFDYNMNEYEAQSYLTSLVDPGNLAGAVISDFEKNDKEPNQYILYIESPSLDKYYYHIGGFPSVNVKSSAKIILTLDDDGELTEYRYYLNAEAEYYGYEVKITQNNIRTFE